MKQDTDNEIIDQTNNGAGAADEGSSEGETINSVEEPVTETERELAELRKTAEDNYQRYLRTQADFDNFRRRSRQEKEDFAKYASQKLIEGLLPIVDNFDRAFNASRDQRDYESLAKGVEMILRQMNQLLDSEGVTPIEAVGKPFNPERHQAIMQVQAEEGVESGYVVEELQRGYMLKDRVIRPSMVKVSE